MTILSSDHARIILGLSSNRLSIGGSTSGSFCWNLELQVFVAGAVFGGVGGWLYLFHAMEMTFHMWCGSRMRFILRGRRSICWVWRVTLLGPRIGNEVPVWPRSQMTLIFVWQGQYLVRLEGDFSWQAQHIVTFWEIARARHVVFYNTTSSPRSAGARWRFYPRIILGYRRISSNRLPIGGSTSGSFCWNLELQVFVAGAVFGEVGGWLYLFHAMEMTFHMSRRSITRFILRGRGSIWWSWMVPLVAPRIVNEVSYVTRINHDIHFCVAGAVFGEVGWCLLLFRAL